MTGTSRRVPERSPGREIYVVSIDDIAPVYDFKINAAENDPAAFKDRFRIEIVGTFQSPSQIRGRRCTVRLFGDRTVTTQLNDPNELDIKAEAVGDLSIGPEGGSYQSVLPQDALFHVATLAGQGLLRCLELNGRPVREGRIVVESISFRLISVHAAA